MKNIFKLDYAPHFGSFEASAGKDPIDQLKYMADLGFKAFEDNGFTGTQMPDLMGIGMLGQPPQLLTKIGETLVKLEMKMGTFVLGPTFWPPVATLASGNVEWRNKFLDQCRAAVDVAKRLNGNIVTVVPDAYDYSLPKDIQTANVIEGLRMASDIFEPHNITMVLEPLSYPPQVFLKTSTECYLLAKAVNSQYCKILFDMYHLQRNEGRLLYHVDLVWDEIGYFQIGDEPGRKEPTTGEINFKTILKYIHQKAKTDNRNFIFGMEHYNSKEGIEGERALIDAYLEVDDF